MRTPCLTLSLLALMAFFSSGGTQERNRPKSRPLPNPSSQGPASLQHAPSSVKTGRIQIKSNSFSQQRSAVSQTHLNAVASRRSKKTNPCQISPGRQGRLCPQTHGNLPLKTSSRSVQSHPGKSSLTFTKKSKTHSGVYSHPELAQSKSLSINQRNVQTKLKPNSLIQPKKSKPQPKRPGQQVNKYIKGEPNKKISYLKTDQQNPGLKSSMQQSGHQRTNHRKSTANKRSYIIKYFPCKTATVLLRKSKSQSNANNQQNPHQPKPPSTSKQNGRLQNKSKPQKTSKQSKLNMNTNLEKRSRQTKIRLPQQTNQRRHHINTTKIKQPSHSKTQAKTYRRKIIKHTEQPSQKQRFVRKIPRKPKSPLNHHSHWNPDKPRGLPLKHGSYKHHSNPFKKNKNHLPRHKPVRSCKPKPKPKPKPTGYQPLPVSQQPESPQPSSFVTKFPDHKPETTATNPTAPTPSNIVTSASTKSAARPTSKDTTSLSNVLTTDEISTALPAITTLASEKTPENITFNALTPPASTEYFTSIPTSSSSGNKSVERATASIVTTAVKTTKVTISTPTTSKATTTDSLPTTITTPAPTSQSSASVLPATTTTALADTAQFNSTSPSNTEAVTSHTTANQDVLYSIIIDYFEPATTMFSTPISTTSTISPIIVTSAVSTISSFPGTDSTAVTTENAIKNISVAPATTPTVTPTTALLTIPAASTTATANTPPATSATTASTSTTAPGTTSTIAPSTSASSTLHTTFFETTTGTPASTLNTTNNTMTIISTIVYDTTFDYEATTEEYAGGTDYYEYP